ncbi:MAG: DUF2125 domain-containing protein [Hyphomicrobiales bacterium]|nr:DUF2125 domain-containing protein [Hyphomicrobiales bacterium]MCP5002287.1 DUF2125 domain-containing protein [Hyphomicrobiales bacterium]
MRARNLKTGIAASIVLLASTQLSFAVDADDFAKKFVAAYASGGMKIDYSGVSDQGSDIVLQNVTVGMEGEPERLRLGDLTFNGVEDDGSGGYEVKTLTEDSIDFSNEEVQFTLKDLVVNNLRIPAEAKMETIDDVLYYDSVTTGPMVVTVEGSNVFQIAKSSATVSNNSDNTRMDFKARADGLEIDLSDVKDAEAQQAINGMGYQYVGGDLVVDGFWSLPTGELTVSEYALTLNDVGRIDLKLSISGYTLDFVRGIQQLQENMAKQANDEKAQQAMGLAMLGMMQQLTFNSLSLRFDDASVTNKVLDMVAGQQGMSRDQMVQGLQGMLPFVLGQLQNPDFQTKVTEAVSLYLADPKNIEVIAQPDSPLPFATIAGSAMGAWQTLPDVLNVSVTANQ